MTEKASSKNWFKDNKNKLLKAGAVIAIGATALTGCKAGAEQTPTTPTPPVEQTQPEVPVTPAPEVSEPPTETEPSSPETVTTYEVDVSQSELYNNLSSADKEKVDKYLDMSLEDFEALEATDRSLATYVLMDAGHEHYIELAEQIELRPGDIRSSLGPEGVDGVSLPTIWYDAVLDANPQTNFLPDNWDKLVANRDLDKIEVKYTEDGWMESEKVPYVASALATGIAFDMAANAGGKYHKNLEYAQKIVMGAYEKAEDYEPLLADLEMAYEQGVDVDSSTMHWPEGYFHSRFLTYDGNGGPAKVSVIFESEDGSGPGLNEQGYGAASYAYYPDAVTTLKDGTKIYRSVVTGTGSAIGGTDTSIPVNAIPYN